MDNRAFAPDGAPCPNSKGGGERFDHRYRRSDFPPSERNRLDDVGHAVPLDITEQDVSDQSDQKPTDDRNTQKVVPSEVRQNVEG